MGKMVKISELKNLDVYKGHGNDNKYIHMGDSFYNLIIGYADEYTNDDFKVEVELVGRMELKYNSCSDFVNCELGGPDSDLDEYDETIAWINRFKDLQRRRF